jgi:hypothetical protein
MNHFPKFDPNKDSRFQLGSETLNAVSLGQKSNQIQPGIGYRVTQTGGGTTVSPIKKRRNAAITSADYIPWKPTFFITGVNPSIVYKCRFNLGTINDVSASNWDEEHILPTDDSVRFVMLDVTTTSGQVTGLEIILESTAPIADTILIDTPPPVWRIMLGVVDKTSGQMIENTNLGAVAAEVYRSSKVVVTPGGEPFSRYWRWNHSAV